MLETPPRLRHEHRHEARDAILSLKQISISFVKGTPERDAAARASTFAAMVKDIHGCGQVDAAAAKIGASVVANDQIKARDLPVALQDKKTGQTVKLGADVFSLVLTNGDILRAGEFKLTGQPQIVPLPVNPNASRFAERLPGKELIANLTSADGNLQVTWHAILRDGSRC